MSFQCFVRCYVVTWSLSIHTCSISEEHIHVFQGQHRQQPVTEINSKGSITSSIATLKTKFLIFKTWGILKAWLTYSVLWYRFCFLRILCFYIWLEYFKKGRRVLPGTSYKLIYFASLSIKPRVFASPNLHPKTSFKNSSLTICSSERFSLPGGHLLDGSWWFWSMCIKRQEGSWTLKLYWN